MCRLSGFYCRRASQAFSMVTGPLGPTKQTPLPYGSQHVSVYIYIYIYIYVYFYKIHMYQKDLLRVMWSCRFDYTNRISI